MKCLYRKNTGGGVFANDLFFAKKNADWVGTAYRIDENGHYFLLKPDGTDLTHAPAILFEIDEIEPDNFLVMADILATLGKYDFDGRTKYYVMDGELYDKDGWEEYIEEF